MTRLYRNPVTLAIIFLIVTAFIFLAENVFNTNSPGSLLLTIVFWTAVIEGCIALAAAADISNGKWIIPLKPYLISVYPILLLLSILVLFLIPQMRIYSWMSNQGFWLNKQFFISRNFIVLLTAFFIARLYARESINNGKRKNVYAVLYLLNFVISQSLVAFDLVMSLEYPWVSTLFGGYFFVESLYSGIAIAGIICFLSRKHAQSFNATVINTQRDTATMMFGFSLFWAGLFYAQYLVIWYGNIPEEVSYLYKRLSFTPFREFSILSFLLLFPVPFIVLLFKRSKSNSAIVFIISLIILLGIFIERLVFLAPITSINPFYVGFEFLCMSYLLVLSITDKNLIFPNVTG